MNQIETTPSDFLNIVKQYKTNNCESGYLDSLCYHPNGYKTIQELFDKFLQKHNQFNSCVSYSNGYDQGQFNFMKCSTTENLKFSLLLFTEKDSAKFGMVIGNEHPADPSKIDSQNVLEGIVCEDIDDCSIGLLSSFQCYGTGALSDYMLNWKPWEHCTDETKTTWWCEERNKDIISAGGSPDADCFWERRFHPQRTPANPKDPAKNVPPISSSPTPSASNPTSSSQAFSPVPSPFSQSSSPTPSAPNPSPSPRPPLNPSTPFPFFGVLGLALSVRGFYQAYTEGCKVYAHRQEISLRKKHPDTQNGSAGKAFAHTGASILWASSALLPQYFLPCALGAIGFEMGAIHFGKKKPTK